MAMPTELSRSKKYLTMEECLKIVEEIKAKHGIDLSVEEIFNYYLDEILSNSKTSMLFDLEGTTKDDLTEILERSELFIAGISGKVGDLGALSEIYTIREHLDSLCIWDIHECYTDDKELFHATIFCMRAKKPVKF